MQTVERTTLLRTIEAGILFVGLPIVATHPKVRVPPVAALTVLAAYIAYLLADDATFSLQDHVKILPPRTQGFWLASASKVIVVIATIAAITKVIAPEEFLTPIKQTPRNLIKELALYSIFSVVPQEMLYRTFFHHRYDTSEIHPALFGLCNATAFGFAHIIFRNKIAVTLTFGAGILLEDTYRKTRSLTLVSLEHLLYGFAIFSFGLGKYFTFAQRPSLVLS